MGKCKTKAIQTDLSTFRHNQTYPGIIQVYSGIFRTLCYPGISKTDIFKSRSIFRTLAYSRYSQPWYIQNPGIFRTLVYSKSEAYSEPCQTSTMNRFAKIGNDYNYFHKACRVLYFMK